MMSLLPHVQAVDSNAGDHPKKAALNQRKKNQNKDRKIYSNKIMSQLSDKEKSRLWELAKADPNAFRQELKKIAIKYKAKHSKKNQEIKKMVADFHAAEGDKKKVIKEKIAAMVRDQFTRKMEMNKKNYEKALKRLQELKQKLDERENNSDVIIEERVRELTKDPALHW
jgi:hypothetical protein